MEIPFVGREKELEILKNSLAKTKETRAGNVYIITGQMGVGKTRLIQEASRIAEKYGYAVMLGRCIDEKAVPFLPVIEAFEKYSTMPDETSKYVPTGLIGAEHEEKTELLGFTREKIRMMEAIMRRFSQISEKQPVMLIIDDIQWADTGTLSVFIYLARNVKNLNLILVGAYPDDYVRTMGSPQFDEFLSNLALEKNVSTLYLHPLKREDISKILSAILGTWKIPEELVEFVHEKTGGNPLFVEEVSKAIQEQGIFDVKTRKLTTSLDKVQMPSSVKSVIAMRLKDIKENEMKVLWSAAVIGRVFDYEILKECAGIDEENLLDILERLVNLRFFEQMPGNSEAFRFMHNPVYEVVYSELTGLRKRMLHKKVGEIIEKKHGKDVKFHADIGRHYMIAGEYDRSVKYLISIAEHSLKNFAGKECVSYCEQVLKLVPNLKDENARKEALRKVHTMLGDCHSIFGDLRKTLSHYEEALTSATTDYEKAEIYIKMSGPYQETGETEKALAMLENAKQLMEASGSKEGVATALRALAVVYLHIGNFEKARSCFEMCIDICKETGDEKTIADAYHGMGTLSLDLGELNRAEEYLYKSLGIRKRLNLKKGLASTYNNLAIIAHNRGEMEKTLEFYEMARKIYEELNDLSGIATINNNLAVIHVPRGETDKAMELYQKNIEISERTGDITMLMLAYRNIAWIYRFLENYPKALEFYEKSLAISRRIGEKINMAGVLNRIAITYAHMGDMDRAFEYAAESLKIAESTGSKDLIADAKWGLGEVYLQAKNYGEAERFMRETLEIYKSLGNPSYIKEVESDLGRVYAGMGKIEEAKKCFNSALEFYRKIGANALVKEVEKELEKIEGKDGS
ncbi:MAG: tetratricopeptide repeat protein [Thermoplasmata archaeon]|nr:tetratricopeptide repeat protein [Thermoplasmata archaeon]